MSYGTVFDRVEGTLIEAPSGVPDDQVVKAAFDAVITFALSVDMPEGEIEKLFQQAFQ